MKKRIPIKYPILLIKSHDIIIAYVYLISIEKYL